MLAPRPPQHVGRIGGQGKRQVRFDGMSPPDPRGDSTGTKRRQREHNKDNPDAKLTKQSGSSGASLKVALLPMVDWDEVEDEVEWVCDVTAKMAHFQVGQNGWANVNMGIPLAYANAILKAHAASQGALIYIRVYTVPFDLFLDKLEDDAEQ